MYETKKMISDVTYVQYELNMHVVFFFYFGESFIRIVISNN